MQLRPKRWTLLLLSVLDCVFGIVGLTTSGDLSEAALFSNFALAAGLAVLTARDLTARGQPFGWVFGSLYLLAPLIGLRRLRRAQRRPEEQTRTAIARARVVAMHSEIARQPGS